jgi:ATP synthase protein I
MFKAVLLQAAIVLTAGLFVMPWMGARGLVSVVLGGTAYMLPNLIFVVRLRFTAAAGTASAVTFFVGELFKVLATITLLALAGRWYDIYWPALLIGLFAALKANLFAFLLKT